VDAFLAEWVEPVLERYGDQLAQDVPELKV
jgi:hypothetical protein